MTPDPQAFNACLARVDEAMNEPLLTRCVDFVTEQSCGEWTEAIIFTDAVNVRNLVLRETSAISAELAAAYERIAELEKVLSFVLSDIADYERVNNLAPSPGKQDCWQSVTHARAALNEQVIA